MGCAPQEGRGKLCSVVWGPEPLSLDSGVRQPCSVPTYTWGSFLHDVRCTEPTWKEKETWGFTSFTMSGKRRPNNSDWRVGPKDERDIESTHSQTMWTQFLKNSSWLHEMIQRQCYLTFLFDFLCVLLSPSGSLGNRAQVSNAFACLVPSVALCLQHDANLTCTSSCWLKSRNMDPPLAQPVF